jgi:pimeloyl-ACP methyl ester carboxylesterase
MENLEISRHFVTVLGAWGPRQVHYRRAGSGPGLLLLHQSPQSSREFEPLMQAWGHNFTVIAPDAPGYGLSDPLGVAQADLEDFAAATMEFADALGLGRFAMYGYHTGGGMAVAVAHEYPDRVTASASNGLVMLTVAERENILANYLPLFTPRWDGAHLNWLWARVREQRIFFPWHERRLAARMNFALPEPAALQRDLLEFLRAGDHYRVAYRAAFTYDAAPVLPQLRVPALITAAAMDPLSEHLERIDARADCVKIERSADPASAMDLSFAHLAGYPGDPPPPPPANEGLAGKPWQDTLRTTQGWRRVRRSGRGPARAVILHDAGGSAATVSALLASLDDALAFDLPGHGEAPAPDADRGCTLASCAQACGAILEALGGEPPWLVGDGYGALVALQFAASHPTRIRGLLLKDPPLADDPLREAILEEGLPSLAPDWHGGHLSRAWHMARDERLFHPWFRHNAEGIRWCEPSLDEAELTLEVRERLVAEGHWQCLAQDALRQETRNLITSVEVPVICCATADSPWRDSAQKLAELAPAARFVELPGDTAAWSAAVRPLLA